MRFGVLGPVTAWTDEGRAAPIKGTKVRALLADLLAHRGEPVSADRLVDDLWGEAPDSTNPAGMLSSKVSQLRRALEDAEPGARELVVSPPPGYVLAVQPDAVDAERFTALVDEAAASGDRDPAQVVDLLERALALWRGPAYGEVADLPFARGIVAQLDERRLTAHEALARARLALGDHARVADDLSVLVDAHPWREELRLAHVLALYRAGRQPDALASYEAYRRALRDELGIDPSSQASDLHHAVLTQDPTLDAPTPASRPPAGPSTPSVPPKGDAAAPPVDRPAARLPSLRTEVVGREDEVAALVEALATPGLVTLAGPGGVGKTTLALVAARQLAADLPDGAWFVDLSAVEPGGGAAGRNGDVDLVSDVVGEALALRRAADAPALGGAGWVADSLRDHRLLLVLDNCEHVIEPAAALVDQLLADVPGATVLVTSREPLGVAGELVVAVAPLAVPGPRDQGTPAVVADHAAVQLFVARARAAGAELEVDGASAPLLGILCRRLDGLPLALELAATRVPALGLQAVVTRLGDRFRLLGSGRRAGPERHRTLQAMLDWSWDLLDAEERRVLRRLAVHADGCTLAAATAVGSDPAPPIGGSSTGGSSIGGSSTGHAGGVVWEAGDVAAVDASDARGVPPPGDLLIVPLDPGAVDDTADVLARLVERSLVVADHRPEGLRYRLLESIGAYAADRLVEAGEADAVRRRHVDWYRHVAERADEELRGPGQARWLAVLDAESANLQTAIDTAADEGLADPARRLVAALGWYWVLRSRTGSARRMLDRALGVAAATGVSSLPEARARAFRAAAALGAGDATDVDDPAAWCAAVLASFDGAGRAGAAERGRAASLLASAALEVGLVAEAESLLDEALTTALEAGDRWGEAVALTTGCMPAHMHGDVAGLEAAALRADSLFAALGDTWGRLTASEWLGAHAELVGDLDRGAKLLEDGLDDAERLGLRRNVSGRLGLLGWIALQRGEWARATDLGERTRRIAVEQGERANEILAGMVLGFTARQVGDLDAAERHLRELLTSSGFQPDDLVVEADGSGGAALAARECSEDAPHVSTVVSELAYVAELRGEPERALAGHRWVVANTLAAGYPRGVVGGLEGAAAALAALGQSHRAARLLGAAAAGHTESQIPRAAAEQRDVDRALERVVADLGPDATDRLLAEGAALGAEGVIGDLAGEVAGDGSVDDG